MGVRGLSTYLSRGNHLTDIELSNSKVIVDGLNLYYFIYQGINNLRFPESDYSLFARACRHYFQVLIKCGISAYVVLDGGRNPDDRNLTLSLKRKQNQINDVVIERYTRMPAIGKRVFQQVLQELNIPYASTHYNADKDIAVLAHKWQCPVMSEDSDFCIYPLNNGCIKLPTIKISIPFEGNTLPVQLYLCRAFVQNQHISADFLPILAMLMGNDYTDRASLLQFYCKRHWYDFASRVGQILAWFKVFKTPIDCQGSLGPIFSGASDPESQALAFSDVVADYRLDGFTSFDLDTCFNRNNFHANLDDYYGNNLPLWFVEGLRGCSIEPFLQDAFVQHRVVFTCQGENIKLRSSTFCSQYIRKCIYGIAVAAADPDNTDIFFVEHDRMGDRCWPFVVLPIREVPGFGRLPNINMISDMHKKERQKLFLSCFHLDSDSLHGIDKADAVVPVLIALSYWMKHAQPAVSVKHMEALLICVIYLHMKSLVFEERRVGMCSSICDACDGTGMSDVMTIEKNLHLQFDQRPDFGWDKTVVHNFCQFFSCWNDVVYLNQVLMNPFSYPSLIVTINCKFAYNLYSTLVSSGSPAESICGFNVGNRYSRLLGLYNKLREKVISLTRH